MTRFLPVVCLAAVAGLPLDLAAQRNAPPRHDSVTVVGRVVDPDSAPVAHATVTVSGARWVTDAEGAFRARVRAGAITVEVRRLGFHPSRATIGAATDTAIVIWMLRAEVVLEEQRVRASRIDALARTGFYDRIRDRQLGLNNGTFITPEEIEERRANRTTQFLERVPGIRLASSPNGAIPSTSANCDLTIYLDGMRLQTYGTSTGGGSNAPTLRAMMPGVAGGRARIPEKHELIDNIVDPNSVAAIEVYPRAAGAPPQYQLLNGTCGVIAIWTKS